MKKHKTKISIKGRQDNNITWICTVLNDKYAPFKWLTT